jgi:hypothetical protein
MKARCCGGDFNDDGTRTLYLEVPPGTHIQIDDEWVIERTADQPADALMERQRRYDEIARELCGGVMPDPYDSGGLELHKRIMARMAADKSDV